MDICSSMFARKKNIPPRNRGGMQQILRCRGIPRCGAAAPHQRQEKSPSRRPGRGCWGGFDHGLKHRMGYFDSCRFGCGFLRCGGYRRTMAGKSPRPGDRDGVCGEPISSQGRPHKSNRHCTESGKSGHESGGCTERMCPRCPRRQSCRGCTHGRWLSRRRQRFRPWLRPA